MDVLVCERGIALGIEQFVERFGNEALLKLKKQMTICTIDRHTKIPVRTPMFSIARSPQGNVLELPRFCLDILKSKGYIDKVSVDLSIGERMTHEYVGKSNPNQQLVVEHILNIFRDKERKFNGITLKLGAGQGKTFCALDLIGKIKRKTLIVVPNTYLLNQWVKRLNKWIPTATVGELYCKRKLDGDIIVGVINSVADLEQITMTTKLPIPNVGKAVKYIKQTTTIRVDDLFAQIGLTIFDESQMYVSKEFRKAFQRIHSRFTIGLSATPSIREDKLDKIHISWIGPILEASQLEGYAPAQDAFTSTATMIKYHGLDEHVQFKVRDDGVIDYQSIIQALVDDPHRNELLVRRILELSKKGHCVFVFSDRRSHLEHLYDLIAEESHDSPLNLELPEANRKVVLYGGSSEETIQIANDLSNIILTTYQYSSTGVSIEKMDCLVLTTPRRTNMEQIINRVFRLGSDQTIERQILDIFDMRMPIKRQHPERIKAYKDRGSALVYEDYDCSQMQKKISQSMYINKTM